MINHSMGQGCQSRRTMASTAPAGPEAVVVPVVIQSPAVTCYQAGSFQALLLRRAAKLRGWGSLGPWYQI